VLVYRYKSIGYANEAVGQAMFYHKLFGSRKKIKKHCFRGSHKKRKTCGFARPSL